MTNRTSLRHRAALLLVSVGVVVGAVGCTSTTTAGPGTSTGSSAAVGASGSASTGTTASVSSAGTRPGLLAGTTTALSTTTPFPLSSRTPPPTTPVPVPGGGNITKTVPSAVVTTAKPVSVGGTASFGSKVSATVTLADITAVAQGPGEVSGPAVVVTVHIVNGTSESVDVSNVAVSVTDKAGTPGNPMSGPPAGPFLGRIGAGRTAVGTYVFALSRSHLNPVSVSLSYSTEAPVVVFVGDAK